MLRINSNFYNLIQTLNQKISYIFVTNVQTNRYVSYTEYFIRLIRTRMVPLRSKGLLIKYFYQKGAFFHNYYNYLFIYLFFLYKSTFSVYLI